MFMLYVLSIYMVKVRGIFDYVSIKNLSDYRILPSGKPLLIGIDLIIQLKFKTQNKIHLLKIDFRDINDG